MLLAYGVGPLFLCVSLLFWASGVLYNVKPMRFKDKAYVDVLTESVNNPLRMMLGWSMIEQSSIAPASLLLAYWMGGAFLMGAKRLSEYREIAAGPGVAVLHRYRRSPCSANWRKLPGASAALTHCAPCAHSGGFARTWATGRNLISSAFNTP